jgi:shikimate kinase
VASLVKPRDRLLILYGPKAVGKSRLARLVQDRFSFSRVDPDSVIPALSAEGGQPDRVDGWLAPLSSLLAAELARHSNVVTEATGAWESDWRLAENLELAGVEVIKGWITAPLETTLHRLRRRQAQRVCTSEEEAIEIYNRAHERAQHAAFAFRLDNGGAEAFDPIPESVRRALSQ